MRNDLQKLTEQIQGIWERKSVRYPALHIYRTKIYLWLSHGSGLPRRPTSRYSYLSVHDRQ